MTMGSTPAPPRNLPVLLLIHAGKTLSASLAAVLAIRGLAMPMSTPAVLMGRTGMSARMLVLASFSMMRGLPVVVRRGLMVMRRVMMVGSQTAFAADLGHVFAIAADGTAALSSGLCGLFLVPFMGMATLMGGAAALTGNFSLLLGVHCRKPAFARISSHLRHSLKRDTFLAP